MYCTLWVRPGRTSADFLIAFFPILKPSPENGGNYTYDLCDQAAESRQLADNLLELVGSSLGAEWQDSIRTAKEGIFDPTGRGKGSSSLLIHGYTISTLPGLP